MTADDNRATWQQVLEFIAEYPETEYWDKWRELALPVINHSLELNFDSSFRAGMAMSHLIFSTLDHHGLKDEPRVTLEIRDDWKIRISLTRSNVSFNEPSDFAIVGEESAISTFTEYLRRLRDETKKESIPSELSVP